MRGEHTGDTVSPLFQAGSSPHARGAQVLVKPAGLQCGIIPTCAGSTDPTYRKTTTLGDHPRMRGEHTLQSAYCGGGNGSSPHARGARSYRRIWRYTLGIIPACAGSTGPRGKSRGAAWDHPRMRREHDAVLSANLMAEGSSPHARGARIVCLTFRLSVRIIPACAGSTPCSSRRARSPWDHPRMRGEHRAPRTRTLLPSGSSPHARGAPSQAAARVCRHGIIPACAGSTHTSKGDLLA